jgi:predicted nucleic acid-binding protein
MTIYLDSSVVLRIVLGEASPLLADGHLDDGVTSALLEVECLRTLDRLRLVQPDRAPELSKARAAIYSIVRALTVVELNQAILERASHPLPLPLGTLDAIHLASALLYREHEGVELSIATHDTQFALAARAIGFEVMGA